MEINVLQDIRQPNNKNEQKDIPKVPQVVPLLVARVRTSLGIPKLKDCTVLIDSGASGSIISQEIAKKLRITKTSECKWNTAAGPMTTNKKLNYSLCCQSFQKQSS